MMSGSIKLTSSVEAPCLGTEELRLLTGELAVTSESPPLSSIGSSSSLLSQSEYAKVVFMGLRDSYPTDTDVCCRYVLTRGVVPQHGDRVGLYKIGWSSVQDFVRFEWAPLPDESDPQDTQLEVVFKAETLPKDESEFWQLCYLTVGNTVCGASVPFQFRRPHQDELCMAEEGNPDDPILVIRSQTAVMEENLHKARNECLELRRCRDSLEVKLTAITQQKDAIMAATKCKDERIEQLLKDNEELVHQNRQSSHLRAEIMASEDERSKTAVALQDLRRRLEIEEATIESLSKDNEHKSCLLREESLRCNHLRTELNDTRSLMMENSNMLEALMKSKNLVHQELLSCQQMCSELESRAEQAERNELVLKRHVAELEKENKALEMTLTARENQEISMKQLELKVQELTLRLQQAAEEYKKLFVEKRHLEKKFKHPSQLSPRKLPPVRPTQDVHSVPKEKDMCCPFCNATFPPGSGEKFSKHYQSHLC